MTTPDNQSEAQRAAAASTLVRSTSQEEAAEEYADLVIAKKQFSDPEYRGYCIKDFLAGYSQGSARQAEISKDLLYKASLVLQAAEVLLEGQKHYSVVGCREEILKIIEQLRPEGEVLEIAKKIAVEQEDALEYLEGEDERN